MIVFWEVDMQNDFVRVDGKLVVPNATKIVPKAKKLMKHALKSDTLILGSVDRHFSDDIELKTFPLHCMNGTEGQKIISELDIKETLYIPDKLGTMGRYNLLNYPDLIDLMKESPKKIMFEKQSIDVFSNPHVRYVLEKLDVTEAIVYGVATEYCVKEAVMGLIKNGIRVYVIEDVIKGIDEEESLKAIQEMKVKGALIL